MRRIHTWWTLGVLVAVAVLSAPFPVSAAPPAGFSSELVVGSGLDGPSGFEIAPDGRIFILQRDGKVRVLKEGVLLPDLFADLPSEASGDRGMIGIAFHPDFGVANHWVYFYYTGVDLLNHLVRFDASGDVGTNGPLEIFRTRSPSQLLHVGGSIRFGPDGKLYFAVGDNGYPPNAQDLSNPHGKILRINDDGSVPPDNPFAGQPGKVGAIWAYGFRNPWRFQFDSETGRLYGGDVGDFTWEELNLIGKGGNYGWPVHEGYCTGGCAGFVDPIHAYNHDGGSGAVTAGPVYRADHFPAEYRGNLFFGDYSRGFIKRAELDAAGHVTAVHDVDTEAGSVVDLKVAPDGSMYYLTYFPGRLYRLSHNAGNPAPRAVAHADATGGQAPLQVSFDSDGSSDPNGDPLTYRWRFSDGTESTEADPTKVFTAVGVYTATLSVSDGTHTAQAPPLVVQVGIPPTLTVASPTAEQVYRAGETITYNIFGTDAAGFDVSDANLTTEVFLHHNTHVHPFLGPLRGRAGSFTIPTTGEASADTWHELRFTVRDAAGLTTTRSIAIRPHTVNLTLATSPPGLGLQLDGVPVAAPTTVAGVTGFQREVSAPPTATAADGTVYHFTGWSDGGAIRHFTTTPETDATLVATYAPSAPFRAEYFDNQLLAGTPVLVRDEPVINNVWSVASPGPGVPADHFSVRWSKREYFAGGRYRFTTAADDGVRLYLDGQLVIDRWVDQGPTAYQYVADLASGEHEVRMEFYDNLVDATAKLSWETTPDQPREVYLAQYWNTPGAGTAPTIPTTAPALARDEPAVEHDWGDGSPGGAVGADHFVARWTRSVTLTSGYYDFTATSDDGVRLFVDGQKLIDRWVDRGTETDTVRVPLATGAHTIVLEYYENAASALARFSYTKAGDLPPAPDWTAQYWNTPGVGSAPAMPTRAPDLTRAEAAIDHDFGAGSPAPGIGADRFVARWSRVEVLPAGLYRFAGAADDGVRVFVDGEPVVDLWRDQNEEFSAEKLLTGGTHTIVVEYYEGLATAQARLTYTRIGDLTAPPGWDAEYFATPDLTGTPVTGQDPAVDFDWGTGRPLPGIPVDGWSARWTRADRLPAGTYTFTVTADDGFRLYVDGVPVLERWQDQPPTTFTVSRALAEGTHVITLEYYDAGGGALARLGYVKTADPPAPMAFQAQYHDNPDLAGEPVVTRPDSAVDFDWGTGSPADGVPADNFSVRWTRHEHLEPGSYLITVTADDGIRVRLDGQIVLDQWRDQPPTTVSVTVNVTGDPHHLLTVEYYEKGGGALARCTVTPA
ncbi:PA14 domain-containing protein [Virgisporangium aliadipatigenens]|uniref:PA14 domain-containing protein n=1 Tax=Virgisporangium aliadipatigenens TaxID=741659 RepID=UPI001943B2F6|nr:PA14 domain-containing protein [Virgisporangium aliadipatigenens]